MPITSTILLSLTWIIYFCIHSLLASLTCKRYVAQHWLYLAPAYRLLFNLISIILLFIPLRLQSHYAGEALWQWQGVSAVIMNGLAVVAAFTILWTLKYYDGTDFSGLKQLREDMTDVLDQERFVISPLHRFVRHPWYFLILIVLWTRSMDQATLISTVLITLYLVIGSRLEENKLLIYHGEQYRHYRSQVPGLFPLPWKYLKTAV